MVWDHFRSIIFLPIFYKQLSYHVYVGVWRVVSGGQWYRMVVGSVISGGSWVGVGGLMDGGG